MSTLYKLFFCVGKNDGTVKGVKYFDAKPKHGIFVRADKLIQDRRGRSMRLSLYDKALTKGMHYHN